MSQREEAEEEGVRPTEPPLCGRPESQTGAQSPEQQRPESAGLRMNVEDNVSTESLPELSNLDIVWCPPYPFDPLADEETIDDVISPLDPKGSLADYGPSSEDRMRMAEDDDDDNLVQSSNSLSRTGSGYSSASSLSFKSDWSKDNIIDFKGGSATLMSDYSPFSMEEEGAADDDDDDDDDDVQPSKRLPELQRPESAGRRMDVEDNVSTDWLTVLAFHSYPLSQLSSGYSSTSSLSFKSDGSKGNTIIDLKETRSILSPEQQRPESAGRRMAGKKNRSTERLSIRDRIRLLKSRTSSGYSSTSSLSFKSDRSKENTLINFKETRSILSPEQQRPESAGRRMAGKKNRSTERLSIRDRIRLLKSRISSGYSSTSGLSFKNHESKDNTIIDFKGRSSTLIPEPQRPESAGRRMDVEDNVSTDRLTVPAFRSRQQSFTNYINFKKSSSLREKDTSLSTTPEIVVGGGMETS